ncbi:MAG: hypothetical protein C0478_15585 [Planctomyces sp.]|nr:hypothetical protein [Planctomyces sp.]
MRTLLLAPPYSKAIECRSTPSRFKLSRLLWDHLSQSKEPIPWPEWIVKESHRRLDKMRSDPTSVLTHGEVWQGIANRW